MNEKKINLKANYVYNTVFQLAVLVIPLVTTPYVSRTLGPDNIGRYSYASAMVMYFVLFAGMGSYTYGQRLVAYHRDNPVRLKQVFINVLSFRIIMSAVMMMLYYAYAVYFEGLSLIHVMVSLNLVNTALDISWLFQGLEDFKRLAVRNLLIRIIGLVGVFILVRSETDTWKYILIIMMSQLLGSLSLWCILPRIPGMDKAKCRCRPFSGFKDMLLLFLPSISIQIYTVLDKSMIGWITGSDYANGCYEQSERIVRLAITVVTSVGTVIQPRVANLFIKDRGEEAKGYVYSAIRIVWLLAIPMMLGMAGVSSVFIPLFLGKKFVDSIPLLCIFSGLVVMVSLANVVGLSYLISTSQQNVYTAAVTIAAAVNLCTNLILIPAYGAIGAAIASVFAETVGTGIQIGYCLVKKQLEPGKIFGPLWKYLLAGLIMLAGILLLKMIVPEGVPGLLILIFGGVLIYLVCLIIEKDSFTGYYLKKIRSRISAG